MRTTFVSTASLLNTPRFGIQRMQSNIVRLNQEVVTGRMADIGLNLGADTGRSLTLHIDTQALDALSTNNQLVTTRLQQTQTALDSLRTGADDFIKQLNAARADPLSVGALPGLGEAGLQSFIARANASDGRTYFFGGINTADPPIADYETSAQTALETAFQAKFGITPDDPAVANIDAADMADFLDNEFSALFDDPAWGTDWSSASDETISNRISPTETVTTSVSANEPAMRKLAMVYTMIAKLGTGNLGEAARNTVIDKAMTVAGQAVDGITGLQAQLGAAQNRVTAANDSLARQKDILQSSIGTLEGVDAAEAKVKIDTLSTQIEMSYSLTAKLLQMSILNYA